MFSRFGTTSQNRALCHFGWLTGAPAHSSGRRLSAHVSHAPAKLTDGLLDIDTGI